MDEGELVKATLSGCMNQCATFITCILARDKISNWPNLWDDFFQEEIWESLIVVDNIEVEVGMRNFLLPGSKEGKG